VRKGQTETNPSQFRSTELCDTPAQTAWRFRILLKLHAKKLKYIALNHENIYELLDETGYVF